MNVVIVGSGIGGLSTALYLQRKGFQVTVLEKLSEPGGRARNFSVGEFSFDMGPSWYLMPEVFQKFYREVGEEVPEIEKVDPLFSLYVGKLNELGRGVDIYASEPNVIKGDVEKYIEDTKFMYELAMERFLFKEMRISDMFDSVIIKNFRKFPIFLNLDSFNRRYFKDDVSLKAVGFSSVFLGGSPFSTPAIYAMVNYAILGKGVYYPKGGFKGLVNKLFEACKRAGVDFLFNFEVDRVKVKENKVIYVESEGRKVDGDLFVFNMDYHYADLLLPPEYALGEYYWERRKLAPSAILGYLGVEGEVRSSHHTIIINGDWKMHFDSICKGKEIDVGNMSYYVSYRKATDKNLKGDDLVFLIPIPPGFKEREEYLLNKAIEDFKIKTGSNFVIKFKRTFGLLDFMRNYNAYKGTAFGLSHTLSQTGPFRPPLKNKSIDNLFYVGQYTQPGIGVPMVTISSMLVGEKIITSMRR
ncbi:phytoene desaturase [Sulfolobus sp. A20-N-F6]|uniref:phytoene desaturase family protein n=1 Tax=Sulfolobaceae TaxID=118883 RepID=UPI0009F7341E|nr:MULTISPECIES: phytoene desaturase family protein [unclassified Sulfolobus]TRM75837.1 phytoene desaturase [Sulfolobus sp. A20-N-F8]TRM81455.1 phytoene desaturase [Sulfolobus sp. D5]TRM82836.1 phytoene desaturase [Sulfolobus sp. A20-N-F6]TRM86576.1 phytoene desaturase [Sulfolobus sp. E3]TRM95286.1 phytoene desaturase [Sulfolobus sp. A20-N-G8]TRN02160.1 phytoene desaturase [Sulfolobus sp. F1]